MESILSRYEQGHCALLLVGRSLHDLDLDDGEIRPVVEILRRTLRARHGMALLRYGLASGFDWDDTHQEERDRRTIRAALEAHRLRETPAPGEEAPHILRGLYSLLRTSTEGLRWHNGSPMRFAALVEFSEHITPGLANGTQTREQLLAIELAHNLAQSLALRKNGNLLLFHARADGLVDPLVSAAMLRVELPQPDAAAKEAFLDCAMRLYPNASFERGVARAEVARLTSRTPNRGQEAMLRASHKTSSPVTLAGLVDQKGRDVAEISEQTLAVLDTSRVNNVELAGVNVATPRHVMEAFGKALRRGDPNIPGSVLLVGPPGGGKTDLALIAAAQAGVNAYQMHSPKGGIVGQTERQVRLQWETLRAWTPSLSFIDEITEAMPMQRSDFDGDSGASRAVTAAMLTALSDETRRGHSLLVATTNCPWRIGEAMRSRFALLPVLHPLAGDYPAILESLARRVAGATIDLNEPRMVEAAAEFHRKGANPRQIRGALSAALLDGGKLTPEAVRTAALDLRSNGSAAAVAYCDLWALKACSRRSWLPWSSDPAHYPFPAHFGGVVDATTGDVDETELDRRLAELRPHVDV